MNNNPAMKNTYHRFCVAPMLDWSDKHCRYFWRLLSKNALLYTEMITTGALLHGDVNRFLEFDPSENPLALQLGGSDPNALAQCANLAEKFGYDEVNLNCGCPSARVQNGAFGACLMTQPTLVADCVKAMQDACTIRVTVKHRIGVDDQDSYEAMAQFVDTIASTGCDTFIVHARKAWLKGLSPKQNREIPPLQYENVYQLKQEFPDLTIVINGGIESLDACHSHLDNVDGVMLGRSAYQTPYLLSTIDRDFFADTSLPKAREQIIDELIPYIEQQLLNGTTLHAITRHILGLYQGLPGARQFRRILSERAPRTSAGVQVLKEALASMHNRSESAFYSVAKPG
ncbi:MAG: tRNA dihydrouridine(20/20a) synthase DusA [Verrucomicrobiaceae bacterium]|nr:tRNA dihydrouridine(20/20a) synthase DusA [Verrucomicrobiaceae bacterium]